MKPSKKQCYCCDQIATTQDHTPPRCFFPKKKHLPSGSPDYRSNLITVPSCSKHNNLRSKDDEYAAAVIVTNSESDLAFSIYKTKWYQILIRNDEALLKRFLSRSKPIIAITQENNILIPYDTLAIAYEVERIYRVIESTARGLYYHESKGQYKWTEKCIVKSPNFLTRDLKKSSFHYELDEISKCFSQGERHPELKLSKKGSQPSVFYYQIFKAKNGDTLIKMVFYEDFIFFARLTAETTTPIHLLPFF